MRLSGPGGKRGGWVGGTGAPAEAGRRRMEAGSPGGQVAQARLSAAGAGASARGRTRELRRDSRRVGWARGIAVGCGIESP